MRGKVVYMTRRWMGPYDNTFLMVKKRSNLIGWISAYKQRQIPQHVRRWIGTVSLLAVFHHLLCAFPTSARARYLPYNTVLRF